MPIILDHVNYIYNVKENFAKHALKDINLVINEGEFVGIIGHTGSGKSTMVQLLNGLYQPTSGHVYVDGLDTSDKEIKRKNFVSKVGLVFQYPEHQLFESTVENDVRFGPKNLGVPKLETDMRTYEAIKLVGLPDTVYDESPFDLSGGQKRRVAIAGVLAMKPKYLVLDEPTAGLDPKGRDEILGLLSEIRKKEGITIILVSHSMDDVALYADRVVVMSEGTLLYDGKPKEIFPYCKELEAVGLAAPQVTYIIEELKKSGKIKTDECAISIEEAKNMILDAYKAKHK